MGFIQGTKSKHSKEICRKPISQHPGLAASQDSDRSICNIGTKMSMFGSIHLQHWYPNVNVRIDPFAALVPSLPKIHILTYKGFQEV